MRNGHFVFNDALFPQLNSLLKSKKDRDKYSESKELVFTACFYIFFRVLVLDNGLIMEFGSPSKLLDLKGYFYSMACDARVNVMSINSDS